MLAIKLRRVGKKHQASFRLVVAEKKSKLRGKFIEDLGWFNPHTDEVNLNKERAAYWVKAGAQPTDSVHNLLVRIGVLSGPKIPVHAKPKKKEEAPAASAEASAGQAGQTAANPVQ